MAKEWRHSRVWRNEGWIIVCTVIAWLLLVLICMRWAKEKKDKQQSVTCYEDNNTEL